jgi:hypothetical protein
VKSASFGRLEGDLLLAVLLSPAALRSVTVARVTGLALGPATTAALHVETYAHVVDSISGKR